ncbi:MAG: phage terminase large subunit-like protein [Dinoroseobacter sp.]|jgi:phage terminase large subunit-like protein
MSYANGGMPMEALGLILMPPEVKSNAAWLSCESEAAQTELLRNLKPDEVAALPWLWRFWAFPHQLPPEGIWRTWVVLGGRGAGKTRAGAEWVRAQVEGRKPLSAGVCRRVALVGETLDQARDVMVFGESGIIACCPPDRKPEWQATRRRLVWPNGAQAQIFSASDPNSLRGPQFDAAWVDELAKWKKGQAAWDMLQFALRLGDDPRQVVTTTPQPVPVLRNLIERRSTVMTHAPTQANRAYLAASFLAEIEARYAGTRLGRQELDGELLEEVEGALWSQDMLEGCRVEHVPELDRIVVAVDPPVTSGAKADACGIIAAGVVMKGERKDWRAYVLADRSVQGASPTGWAEAAVALAKDVGADRIVAEVNQGGELVTDLLRQVEPSLPVTQVRATKGKARRAEPVAALYEQGRVSHVRGLPALEDEMCRMTVQGFRGAASPDRLDALVWAIHALMIAPSGGGSAPRMRIL